jgi:putative tricarboxylic transport membrane protein
MASDLAALLQPSVLLYWMLGMIFGLFVGATPGLTATMGVALVVPISFYLPPEAGLAMIIGVSFTAIFAGDIPATFLRIPGTPASTVATLDSHELARRGRAPFALLLNLCCSAIGGLIGVILFMVLARQLAGVALQFSSFEFFWLAVVGLSLSAVVSVGSTFRGILAALLGMLIRTIGVDMVSATPRFTFDNTDLAAGLSFIPAMIGLFGLSEVLRGISSRVSPTAASVPRGESTSAREIGAAIWSHKGTIAGSSILGTFVGALPGAGADIAAWVAYGLAQRFSGEGAKFGQGAVAGVIAPTSANNAAVAGAWIPALVLGIPGDSVTAIVLGALVTYNIQPGPEIFTTNPHDVQRIFLIALITQFLLIPCGFLGIRAFGWILRLPRSVVYTGVIVFSVLGAYAPNSSLFDIWVMVAFGVLGYFLERWRVPLAPLILGMILGPMVEENLRVGLIKSGGSPLPFFTRPISAALALSLAAMIVVPLAMRWTASREATISEPPRQE